MELSQALGIINFTFPDEVRSLADLLSPNLIEQSFNLVRYQMVKMVVRLKGDYLSYQLSF